MNNIQLTKNQWIRVAGVVAVLVVGIATIYFSKTTPEQKVTDSPGSINTIGQIGSNTMINNNQFPKPTIEYSAVSSPTLDKDGFYHQIFQLKFYYVLGTAPERTFNVSDFFTDCSEPEGSSAPSFSNGRYFESSTIECWMKTIPPTGTVLFWYPD